METWPVLLLERCSSGKIAPMLEIINKLHVHYRNVYLLLPLMEKRKKFFFLDFKNLDHSFSFRHK